MKKRRRSICVGFALFCLSHSVHAAGTVTECTETNLRAALAGGGTVTFACDGTIPLATTLVITNDARFEATGRAITLSGNDSVRVIEVKPVANLELIGLTITHGRANQGAGILNGGGHVFLSGCVLAFNQAMGTNGADVRLEDNGTIIVASPGEPAFGGALWNAGSLVAVNTAFQTNSARAGNGGNEIFEGGPAQADGANAAGGAVFNTGDARLTNCTFASSVVVGGNGGNGYLGGRGGHAKGGAILNAGGTVAAIACTFGGNTASAGFDGSLGREGYRGNAFGGGVCNTGTLQLVSATFLTNTAVGANAGGGGVFHAAGMLGLDASKFTFNRVQGDKRGAYYGLQGGFARGGAVFNGGEAKITDTTISSNSAIGGNGGGGWALESPAGGDGRGGGVFNSGIFTLLACTLDANWSQGGVGAAEFINWGMPGGTGFGGACASVGGQISIANSTLSGNCVFGGKGGNDFYPHTGGQGGGGVGGGIHITNGVLRVTNSTIAVNSAYGGPGGDVDSSVTGPTGQAHTGGIWFEGSGSFSLYNSIVAQNTSGDVCGTFTGTPNLIGGDPRLGPLADNGGPTWTMALLPDSPAIDAAVSLPGITADQRGVSRPYGATPDLGAFEWNATTFATDFRVSSLAIVASEHRIRVCGPTNQTFRLCVSSNLSDWIDLQTNATDEKGMFDCTVAPATTWPVRFYRTVSP